MISPMRAENQWAVTSVALPSREAGRAPLLAKRREKWRATQANVSHPLRGVLRPSFAWAGVFVPNRTPNQCGTTFPSTARGLKLDGAAAEEVGVFPTVQVRPPKKTPPKHSLDGPPSRVKQGPLGWASRVLVRFTAQGGYCAADRGLNPYSAPAEAKCCDHFGDDLFVCAKLPV